MMNIKAKMPEMDHIAMIKQVGPKKHKAMMRKMKAKGTKK